MIRVNYHTEHLQAVVDALSASCSGPINFSLESIIVIACCILGIIWAIVNMIAVTRVNVEQGLLGDEDSGSDDSDLQGRRRQEIPR